MKITDVQVNLIETNKKGIKQQLRVTLDPSTYAGRWGISEMFRCQKFNCRWPDLHRLGTVKVITNYPKPSMQWAEPS